jgi:hypothetical protein
MKKEPRGSHNVVLELKAVVCVVRWHDSKVVTVASTFAGVHPIQKAKHFSSQQKQRIEVDQPKVVQIINNGMGGVNRFDQIKPRQLRDPT